MLEPSQHLVSVAPMMKRTDRHFRWMMRLITRRTLLYTEMIPALTIVHGDRDRFLGFDAFEHPVALQLGGDDPAMLAECARIAEDYGYDEVNLNIGCPSPRVQKGNFGACLMQTPDVVARSVEAMRAATSIPVTVKHRVGVDDQDEWDDLLNFVEIVAEAGCARFSVHARKAWLKGLSPKENRNIPPLRPDLVYRLKKTRPDLLIEMNGHVHGSAEVLQHLQHVDAVMVGRAAYDDPYSFVDVDREVYGDDFPMPSREDVAEAMTEYARRFMNDKRTPLTRICQHLMNLFAGEHGAKTWRRHMTIEMVKDGARPEVITDALALRARSAPDRDPATVAAAAG